MVLSDHLNVEYLLTLRLWQEDVGGGRKEWRCRVRSESSGEVRYFSDWQGLVGYLQELLPISSPEAQRNPETGNAFTEGRSGAEGMSGVPTVE
jgi:hypothetical protein